MITDVHKKNFAVWLSFIMRFKATRKWPIHYSLQSRSQSPRPLDKGNPGSGNEIVFTFKSKKLPVSLVLI